MKALLPAKLIARRCEMPGGVEGVRCGLCVQRGPSSGSPVGSGVRGKAHKGKPAMPSLKALKHGKATRSVPEILLIMLVSDAKFSARQQFQAVAVSARFVRLELSTEHENQR